MKLLNLTIQIPWRTLDVGMSVFVPHIDPTAAERLIVRRAEELEMTVVCRTRIEGGRLGLRFWRVS